MHVCWEEDEREEKLYCKIHYKLIKKMRLCVKEKQRVECIINV